MPWKALSMSEQRLALIHRIVTLKQSVGEAALAFGVSRKTAHKWLARYQRQLRDFFPELPDGGWAFNPGQPDCLLAGGVRFLASGIRRP